jgi:multimeric flavodoxin WrbA
MQSDRPKVLAIGSSPRKEGNTEQFLKFALSIISEHDISTEYIGLRDKKIEGCISCRHCRVNEVAECAVKDDFQEIFQKVCEADGLILGSPVYFGTQTAKMTALLERLGMVAEGRHAIDVPLKDVGWPETKGPGLWAGKVGGAIVSTRRTGGNFVLAELLLWFSILGFIIVSGTYWTVAIGGTRIPDQVRKGKRKTSELSKDQFQKDPEAVKAVKDFALQFAKVVNKMNR